MAKLGYGKGYKYPHDYVEQVVAQEYLPEELSGARYYEPGEAGFERDIRKRLAFWDKLRGKTEGSDDA